MLGFCLIYVYIPRTCQAPDQQDRGTLMGTAGQRSPRIARGAGGPGLEAVASPPRAGAVAIVPGSPRAGLDRLEVARGEGDRLPHRGRYLAAGRCLEGLFAETSCAGQPAGAKTADGLHGSARGESSSTKASRALRSSRSSGHAQRLHASARSAGSREGIEGTNEKAERDLHASSLIETITAGAFLAALAAAPGRFRSPGECGASRVDTSRGFRLPCRPNPSGTAG